MSRIFTCFITLIYLSFSIPSYAQTSGGVAGRIYDKTSGDELPGSTVRLKGTTVGVVADIYGEYFITLPGGEQILEFSFLGYVLKEEKVNIDPGTIILLDVAMEPDAIQIDEITITGQALGQMAAINQQIRSNTIVNVVSKDKIESLPDQNAAESVGRLAGVSIQREGGEGQKVTVRGLSPRFNAITVNGQRLPSSDANDRSFDLSTLSADALQGIELFKSWTPNLEGDAIGGTVNFITKKAEAGWHGKFRYLHGYNNQQEELGQHRINADISNRFLNDKLGVLLSGNFQRADRSQDRLDQDFVLESDLTGQAQEIPQLENVGLEDRRETRDRYGATAAIDYTFPRGDIRLFSNWSRTDRDRQRIRRRYRFDTRRQEYEIIDDQTENSLFANTLSGKYNLANNLEILWSGSYSKTEIRTPFNHSMRFRENSAFNTTTIEFPNQSQIIDLAQNKLDQTFLQRSRSDEDNIDFERYSVQLDLSYPITLSDKISGKVKAGAKYRVDNRIRDIRRFQARESDQIINIIDENGDLFNLNGNQILIDNFFGDYVAQDFLDGELFLGPGTGNVNGNHLSTALANQFFNDFLPFYERDVFVDGSDYEADESITSAYFLVDFKIGQKLNVLAGVRNETTDLDYVGFQIAGSAASSEIEIGDDPRVFLNDSIVSRSYSEWLPSVNVKYAVTDWLDIRGAVTKTLSRPSFINLVPFASIDLQTQQIQRGNFNLEHQTSWNYDLFFSFYNKFGLLTIGGFYKEIDNVDFVRRSLATPNTPNITSDLVGFSLIQPENAGRTSTVTGLEIDFQATLSSLPEPWNGIVFSANATFVDSETFFPQALFAINPTRPIDGERDGTLPGQPNQIYNIAVGYEKGGFSGRISLIHQGRTFGFGGDAGERLGGLEAELDLDASLDQFVQETTRIDLAIKQKIQKKTTIFFNANNITNQKEVEILRAGQQTSRQVFGFTMDLGLEYKF